MWWQIVIGIVSGLLLIYAALAVLLWSSYRHNPNEPLLRETLRLVPDVIRLLRRLAADPKLPRGVRIRLGLLIVYLLSPIDLIPDFIPVLGYADDALIVAVALRSVTRRAGPAAVQRHWPARPTGYMSSNAWQASPRSPRTSRSLSRLASFASLGNGCLVGARGRDDELDDRIQGNRSGVDYQVVQGCVGRVASVQAADVGRARLISRAQAVLRLFLADAFDRRSLHDAAFGWAVEADVIAAVLAEHDRRSPPEDHAAAAGQQLVYPGLAMAAQTLVLVVGGWRRLGRPCRHRLGEMGQQPVHRGGLDLVRRQLLVARPGLGDVAFGRGDPLQKGQTEPVGQSRRDDATAGTVGRRHSD